MFRTLVNVPELSRVGNQVSKESEYKAKQWKEQFRFLTNLLTNLLIAKFRLKLNKVGKTTRPFRYDLNQIPYNYTVEERNRFKGIDLIECLMNYGWRFMTLYRKQGSRTSPGKEIQKSKMAVWGGLTNSCEKEENWKAKEKSKGISIWIQSSKE